MGLNSQKKRIAAQAVFMERGQGGFKRTFLTKCWWPAATPQCGKTRSLCRSGVIQTSQNSPWLSLRSLNKWYGVFAPQYQNSHREPQFCVPTRWVADSGNEGCPGETLVPAVDVRHFQFCTKRYRYHARRAQCFTCFTRALHAPFTFYHHAAPHRLK